MESLNRDVYIFMLTLFFINSGTYSDKIHLFFSLFDESGDGLVDKAEIEEMLR